MKIKRDRDLPSCSGPKAVLWRILLAQWNQIAPQRSQMLQNVLTKGILMVSVYELMLVIVKHQYDKY